MDLREAHLNPAARHPWEIARLRFFRGLLAEAGILATTHTWLDVGAGDAWFATSLLPDLPHDARITCLDAGYDDHRAEELRARLPDRVALVQARPGRAFGLVTLMDVLEHVEDDRGLLRAVVTENVQPQGWLLMSVPAWQPLYTRHDAFLHHHRRYSPAQARAVLQDAGLQIVKAGGLFHSLLLPRALTRLREALRPPRATRTPDEGHQPEIAWHHGPLLTGTVQAALGLDNALSAALARAGIEAPGLTYWALCRRAAPEKDRTAG